MSLSLRWSCLSPGVVVTTIQILARDRKLGLRYAAVSPGSVLNGHNLEGQKHSPRPLSSELAE